VCKRYNLHDAYDVAWQFAAKAHVGQKLPGSDLPYLTHIGWVVGEILISLQHETISDPKLAIQCAILHDVIEDTSIGYQDLNEKFGPIVSDGVSALTKNMALPKNQRMMDSLERILSQPNEVGMVKLADRISNLRTPPSFWDGQKIAEYIEESNIIISMLGKTSTYLSGRIKMKLREYQSNFIK
jgi:(p)ppGpp synthase/HD superfamily hydrolase